jgi:hypothetical protein
MKLRDSFIRNYILRLIEKQNGGNYNKVLNANEAFVTGEGNNHRISGIQFSAFPATITVAKTKNRKGKIIDLIPLQKGATDADLIVYDNTYVFGHEFGYTEFTCNVDCTVNLIVNDI